MFIYRISVNGGEDQIYCFGILVGLNLTYGVCKHKRSEF